VFAQVMGHTMRRQLLHILKMHNTASLLFHKPHAEIPFVCM